MLAALLAAGDVLRPRDFVRQLQQVVAASPALADRELIKLAGLSDALAAALAARGADRHTAELCASIGMAVLRQATQRWIQEDADFADLVHSTASNLVDLVTAHANTAATRHGP